MTAPTITYGHGYCTDCNDTTGWAENLNNMVGADASLTVLHGDIFDISAKFDGGAGVDEYVYYEKDIPNIYTNTYTHYVLRYKTDSASVYAKAVLVFTGGVGTQTILENANNTLWTVVSGTITAGHSLSLVRLYADDAGVDDTFHVYYDFLLCCKNKFTFPFTDVERFEMPRKDVELDRPSRDGGILQPLGMKSPVITLGGHMQHGQTWGSHTGVSIDSTFETYGEYLMNIARDRDAFQWFTSDLINCKVRPTNNPLKIEKRVNEKGAYRYWELKLKQYSLSSLTEDIWDSMQWAGVPP